MSYGREGVDAPGRARPARPRKTADGALWPTEPEGRAIEGAALLLPLPKLELPLRGRANPCSKVCARRTSTSAANGSGPVGGR